MTNDQTLFLLVAPLKTIELINNKMTIVVKTLARSIDFEKRDSFLLNKKFFTNNELNFINNNTRFPLLSIYNTKINSFNTKKKNLSNFRKNRTKKLENLIMINEDLIDLKKGTIVESRKVLHELTEREIQEVIRSFGIQNGLSREIVDDEDEANSKGQSIKGLQKADDSVRWYLQLIGRVRLLRPEEEIQLAREI